MAKSMGDSYNHRITLRVNDSQFQFLTDAAELLGVTPSEYLRMVLNMGAVSAKKIEEGRVGMSNENIKTNIDDKL